MNEMEELVARAIAAAILAQIRSGATLSEQPELTIADDDSNSFWRLAPVAKAAIEAITSRREPCGVCGCAVYPGLPTSSG